MGVRFLQTFMAGNVPNGMLDIDMKREVEEYKKNNNGKVPIIVVDLLCFLPPVYRISNHEILLGGRYNKYVERISSFLGKLKSIGANLVFFLDGPTQESKILTILDRKNIKYITEITALNAISRGRDLRSFENSVNISQAPDFFNILQLTAHNFGEVHRSFLNECDLELASFASENDAFAIISNDTDFLIYEGNWHFWSGTINFDTLHTNKYNKDGLYKTLGLSANQMPIFATLSGNDIIHYDMVKQYHVSKVRNGSHFYGIADVIKCLGYNARTISSANIMTLSRIMFPTHKQSVGLAHIQASLDSYDYSMCVREYENELLKEATKSPFNYVILSEIPHISELHYFNISKTGPFFNIISPIIKRVMGILLYDKKNDPNIKRTFYAKTSHCVGYQGLLEEPEYPEFEVLDILELLAKPIGDNPKLDNLRYNLLCWAVSPKLESNRIQDLPSQGGLLDVLTLVYLHELKEITTQEADCILLACRTNVDTRDDLILDNFSKINERDSRTAFLFPVVRISVRRIFGAVGLLNRATCPHSSFDGLYFHHLRKTWDIESTDYRKAFLRDYEQLRLYAGEFER